MTIALEVVMSVPADARPLSRERADETKRRQGVARSIHDRSDVAEFKKPGIKPDAASLYNHEGTVVVACAWFAFYAIVAIHHLMVAGN
jgi:hypothetical protein